MKKQSKVLIIGVDSSLSCTAWGVLKINKEKEVRLIDYGKIIPNENLSFLEKCKYILTKLDEVFEKYQDQILEIGIEQPNSFRNGKVTRMLSGLYAIIRYFVWIRFGLNFIEVNTIHAKKSTSGNYRADKKEIVDSINKIFGTKFVFKKTQDKTKTDEDIADAISIGLTLHKDLMEKKNGKNNS